MSKVIQLHVAIATSVAIAPLLATSAFAQPIEPDDGLKEIVVTAQKREQRLQDVPVAITAVTQDDLKANRVMNVADLTGLAPNVTVRPSAGGSQIPVITSRGITATNGAAGADREFSIYLDGVYISTARSLFSLPDIERIEVLRGPQGTLFGRNSTSGAMSIVTRSPSGQFAIRQELTVGNYDQFRTRTTVESPSFGPFSAYATYVHDERRGDIRNVGAGTFWDRTGPNTNMGAQNSPRYLGSHNQEMVFAALKFEPNSNFRTTYKFDYLTDRYTPEGTAFVGADPNVPLLGSLVSVLIQSQPAPVLVAVDGKRPDAVNNSWAVPGRQKVYGHSLTSDLRINDHLSLKNVAAYRYSFVTSASQISGLGGLVFTPLAIGPFATLTAFSTVPGLATAAPEVQVATISSIAEALAPLVGQRFVLTDTNAQSQSKQWSNELQLNYRSELLTLTVGGLDFHSDDLTGAPPPGRVQP